MREVVLPAERISKSVYRLWSTEREISVDIDWDEYAVPQGTGHYENGLYIFRRVDCLWVVIISREIADIVAKAVERFSSGYPVTFADLSIELGNNTPLKIAYAAGLLGRHITPQKEENGRKYIITEGWLERVLFFNSYYSGLAVFEEFNSKTFCSLSTFWWDKKLVANGTDTKIEDEITLDMIESLSGKRVCDIVQEFNPLALRVASILIGAGLLKPV
ncbi:MAG: hypothetical protein QW104_01325 [Nitrososphaerota archaeon]